MVNVRFMTLNRHEIQTICFLCSAVFFYGTIFHFLRSKTHEIKSHRPFPSKPLKFFKSGEILPKLDDSIFIIIFINSIPKAFNRRQTIRETWARTENTINTTRPTSLRVSCVFLIGLSESNKIARKLSTEAKNHNDILQINVQESYRNMVYKIWSGFRWILRFNPQYIVKADDDIYLSIPRLINWLDYMKHPRKLYVGWVKQYTLVVRRPTHRWYVSFHEFSQRFFPPYCIGPMYIFSGDLLERLLAQTAYIETFHVEDAYLGVLMRNIGIEARDDWKLIKVAGYGPYIMKELRHNKEYLSDAICIGERLDSKMIRYIHQIHHNVTN